MNDDSDACTKAANLALHPLFRASNIYQMIISYLSILPLFYFLAFKFSKSSFHGNLKVIFYCYFITLILFSTVYGVTATIQFIRPLTAIRSCDLIVPSLHHKIGNLPICFLVTLSAYFPFTITVERYYAMNKSEKYEKMPIILGPLFVLFIVIVNFGVIFQIYKNETFSHGDVAFSLYSHFMWYYF
nr:RecName: Full=Serpentine receptor class beta-10; Short=Protein srb-10 [Caenorhabditis elegans]